MILLVPFPQRERIEELVGRKTPYSSETMARKARKRYAAIEGKLEPTHLGEFVMFEVDTGDYFIGDSPRDAYQKAADHPGKAFHLTIGHSAAGRLKRIQSRPGAEPTGTMRH